MYIVQQNKQQQSMQQEHIRNFIPVLLQGPIESKKYKI